MLFRPPPTLKSNRVVTGKSLARRKMRAPERTFFVADVLSGDVDYKPTIGQLARGVGVSLPCVRAARQIHHDLDLRFDVLTGAYSLLAAAAKHKNGKGKKSGAPAMTPAAWAKADLATRRQFIADLGLASVWFTHSLIATAAPAPMRASPKLDLHHD